MARTVTVASGPSEDRGSLLRLLFGRSLANSEDQQQRVGPAHGIPIFGLDALGSAAYGPEAALTVFFPAGAAALAFIFPLTICIIVLLAIVYFSYRQTIEAYPTGGGSYTVARENLGKRLGLLAGTALMMDYLLNVAVGISTGVGAVISAFPQFQSHTLGLCLTLLGILTLVNLRGVRETGLLLMMPTYVFIACLLGTIAVGLIKAIASGGHPMPVSPPHPVPPAGPVAAWLLIKAFSGGCTAMTGVEAVSNGVQAFKEPVVHNARRTLTIIIGILMLMLAGIGYLARAYHIGATVPGQPGYESVLSQLVAAVAGKQWFYYVTIVSILAVLALSANTSFADFPRLCHAMAQDRFLPYGFALRGRRLVYTWGIWALAILSAALLIVFGGITDRLIPLFAIGAFLSFTMSQAGMVLHWRTRGGRHAGKSMFLNSVGAIATGLTTLVVAVAKFAEGAWITILLIPAAMMLMLWIHRHYRTVEREIGNVRNLEIDRMPPPLVVVPIEGWDKVSQQALRFAMTVSEWVQAIYVDSGQGGDDLRRSWDTWVSEPAKRHSRRPPELVIVKSPYRLVVGPILDYVLRLEQEHTERQIAVVLSELVDRHWYHFLLHNQRSELLNALLVLKGDRRVVVVNVPWHLQA